MARSLLLVLLLTLCDPLSADIGAFIRYPTYDTVSLSPAGTYLAVTHRKGRSEYLTVLRLPELEPVSSTRFATDIGIDQVLWASETRLLIQPARRDPSRDDYRLPTGEIAAMDVDGTHREMLFGALAGFGQLGIKTRKRESDLAWARIVDLLPEDPEHVVIQTMGYGRKGIRNEALLLDVRDGETRRLARSPIRNADFVTDVDHNVNLLAGGNEAGDYEVYLRQGDGDFELLRRTPLNAGYIEPLMPSLRPGYYLFADSASDPMLGLVEWNPQTDDRREVFRRPDVDYDRLFVAPYPHLWAVRYVDHFPYYDYPDPSHPFVALHKSLRATFPDDDVVIFDETDDLRLALAYVSGPQNPGTFVLVDVKKREVLQTLERRPWLHGATLAKVEPIEVTVRDGLTVRGYLTLPPGGHPPLPLIVLVHGGPYGIYDRWGFDSEAQLFASRGYAVLQVNFRGSGGRGQAFRSAGYREWGARMQDDITDSVHYVVSEGIADPDRICIYGASYGGYSALVGVYRDPDLYRCAAGYAGIYDLPMMFEKGDIREVEAGTNFLESVLGTDRGVLEARSPAYNAAKIKVPVMLVHGALDERAPIAQARRMRKALIAAGNEPVWLIEPREGHGFRDDANRLALYEAMLAFFDANTQPAGTAAATSTPP